MTTTITETKKTTIALIREYKNKFITAWPCILLFFFVYLHILLIKIFPSSSELVNVWTASLYQIIGAGCVLYQINGSLKILKGNDFAAIIKQYFLTLPKRLERKKSFRLKIDNVVSTTNISKVILEKSKPETLEEKIECLSKRIDELDKKVEKNQKNLTNRINNTQKKKEKQISTLQEEIRKLNGNLENTVIGDYQVAIFGALMIIYGIIIPIIGLYV